MSECGVDVMLGWSGGVRRWCGCDVGVVKRGQKVVVVCTRQRAGLFDVLEVAESGVDMVRRLRGYGSIWRGYGVNVALIW